MYPDNAQNVQQVIGSYSLRQRIISDTVSAVYHATHISTKRDVIIRVIHTGQAANHIIEFMENIQELGRLKQAHLVPIIDSGIDDEEVYIVMPYYSGGTLQERMDQIKAATTNNHDELLDSKKLPALFEVAQMVENLAYALDYIHHHDIIHHQVQPSSILFDREGRAYLADTGLAKLMKVFLELRQTNAIYTNAYSPPEHWEGLEPTVRSDQYALATIAYELITGRQLFQSKSIVNLMNMHMNDFLIPPHQLRDKVPGSLTLVLVKALAKDPEQRFNTVTEFATALKKSISKVDEDSTNFFTFNVRALQKPDHDVAIGHSMSDLSTVKTLIEGLQSQGLSVWNASEMTLDTGAWTSTIRNAVNKTGAVVILLNADDSMDSNWVNTFITHAKRLHRPLYALHLKGVHRHRNQFTQIFDAEADYNAGLEALVKAIKSGL